MQYKFLGNTGLRVSELKSPVNLTLVGPEIWVTESQIRHRLIPGEEGNIPDRFFIRRFGL